MPIAAVRQRTARTAPSSAACGSARRSPSPEILASPSTRVSSASRDSPPPARSATGSGSLRRWCAARAASWSPPPGRRRSAASPSTYSARARTSAPAPSAQDAAQQLQIVAGQNAALASGRLQVLVRERLFDAAFIEEQTEGFAQVRASVAGYWPDLVERITGVPEAQLVQAARMLGCARGPMVLTGRGPEQQVKGVANTLAFINVALALGRKGRPFTGYGCLTGQGHGQGGREHGQK